MIVFENVTKQFPNGARALDDVSFEARRGGFCVILGPSGAGKSTLLRSVNGLAVPTAGAVRFDGITVEPKTLRRVRRRVSMIYQQFNLAGRLGVLDNVLTGALASLPTMRALTGWHREEDRRTACRLLEQVGLGENQLYQRAETLSGGQQQRVAIARAFISKPEAVLADEPVASLDPKISRDILELLRNESRACGATVLCSLHQVELAAEFADRVIGMADGRIVFDGRPDELSQEALERIYHNGSAGPDGARPQEPERERDGYAPGEPVFD